MRSPGYSAAGAVSVSELTAEELVADDDPTRTGSLCAQADPPPQSATATMSRQILIVDVCMSFLAIGFIAFKIDVHCVGYAARILRQRLGNMSAK
jgi:hypothetical protein